MASSSHPMGFRGRRVVMSTPSTPAMLAFRYHASWAVPTELRSASSCPSPARYLRPGELSMVLPRALAGVSPTPAQPGAGLPPRGQRSTRLRAVWAAKYPHMPCTPPPGGVEEEQKNSLGLGVAYGVRLSDGRVNSWRRSWTPPLMSPPT